MTSAATQSTSGARQSAQPYLCRFAVTLTGTTEQLRYGRETRAGHGRERSDQNGHAEAQAMLDTFASVGATRFDVTLDDTRRRQRMVPPQRERLPTCAAPCPPCSTQRPPRPAQRDRAPAWPRRRPSSSWTTSRPINFRKLAPAVFLALETSPGNFQAWVALPGMEDKDFARRLRQGTGADATASGATRVAGSLNFKDKYAPGFPRVAIHAAQPGRMTDAAELERLGLGRTRRKKLPAASHCPCPLVPPAATANGRAMHVASTARRSTARKPAPIPAGRILCGA